MRSTFKNKFVLPYGWAVAVAVLPRVLWADWPLYRHDARRSGATEETLAFPLQPAWTYAGPQPPAPAWPDPFKLVNRLDFDYAFALTVASGLVCFGSSADDTVRALDAKTGREQWHFVAGGPVRFAPQVEKGRVYFGADDGVVYCLDAGTGRPLWTFRAAPSEERCVGNHRMISRWPIRTGVLVADEVAYAAAGLWPAEGVFIYALRADTGREVWCNDTVGGIPQGALLIEGDILLVPNSNAKTTPLDRRTGQVWQWPTSNAPPGWVAGTYLNKQYMGGSSGRGGTWVTVDEHKEYSVIMHRANELAIEPYALSNGLALRSWWGAGVVPQLTIDARPNSFQTHERGKVSALVRAGCVYARKAYSLALAGDTLLLGYDGAVSAEYADSKTQGASERWRAAVDGEARELAVADGRLFVSTSAGALYCFESAGEGTGGVGRIQGSGFGAQRSGVRGQESESGTEISDQSNIQHPTSNIVSLLQQAGMDRGFALVLGDGDGQLSQALAAQTRLRIVNAQTDPAAVNALRERLLNQTAWYGSRIHVQPVERLDALPFASYFANAVIVVGAMGGPGAPRAASDPGLSGKELYRVLRPCGGIMLFPALSTADAQQLMEETGALESEAHILEGERQRTEKDRERSTANMESPEPRTPNPEPYLVRGKLPGALDWDSNFKEMPGDRRVQWPLRLLWYGGPCTRQVQEFVEKAAGPVLANGRSFILGEQTLTAVDAYNGTVLWSRPVPKCYPDIRAVEGVLYTVSDPSGKYGRPGRGDMARSLKTSDDYVYLHLGAGYFQGKGAGWMQLDARTGEQKKVGGAYHAFTPVTLTAPHPWSVAVNSNCSGAVTLAATDRGLALTLTTRDARVTPLDAWELFFDFRPVEARYGLYDHGVFHVRVTPARTGAGGGTGTVVSAAWTPLTAWSSRGPTATVPSPLAGGQRSAFHAATSNVQRPTSNVEQGVDHAVTASVDRRYMTAPSVTALIAAGLAPLYPQLEVSGTHDANGTETTVALAWEDVQQLVGVKPSSFGFAAALSAHDGGSNEPIARRYLFGDWAADGLDNGWASVAVDEAPPAMETNPPAILTAPSQDKQSPSWGAAGREVDLAVRNAPTAHPLTGEPVPKIYWSEPGCGDTYYAAQLLTGRGRIYDLLEADGYRPMGGVKTGCSTPQVAALGLLFVSEETGHCVCNYPLRTTLALAPADRRLNEDWAQYCERDVDTRVRQAHLNFGASGDRRDDQGRLWVRFPRPSDLMRPEDFPNPDHGLAYPVGMRDAQVGLWHRRALRALWVPLEMEGMTNFGPYRFNTDRVPIQGTDRPWLYGSGYRGILQATLRLNFFKPLVSSPALRAPVIDGSLDDALWRDELCSTNGTPSLPYTGTRVAFRHDGRCLYVGVSRPPMTVVERTARVGASAGFTNAPRPWRATTNSMADTISDRDNWWRLIISSDDGRRAAHFTLTPAGVRADARQDPAGGGAGQARTNLDVAWNPEWQCAAQTNAQGWTMELALPWSSLAEAGVSSNRLAVNYLMFDPGLGSEALTYLGIGGYDRCSNFTPVGLGQPQPAETRRFTVRLHFAEPDATARAGQRVFDVWLQGQPVLTAFDIVKEAGGARTAVVKEFLHVPAAETLTVAFKPRSAASDASGDSGGGATAPILNALELTDELWSDAAAAQ